MAITAVAASKAEDDELVICLNRGEVSMAMNAVAASKVDLRIDHRRQEEGQYPRR